MGTQTHINGLGEVTEDNEVVKTMTGIIESIRELYLNEQAILRDIGENQWLFDNFRRGGSTTKEKIDKIKVALRTAAKALKRIKVTPNANIQDELDQAYVRTTYISNRLGVSHQLLSRGIPANRIDEVKNIIDDVRYRMESLSR